MFKIYICGGISSDIEKLFDMIWDHMTKNIPPQMNNLNMVGPIQGSSAFVYR